MTVYLRVHPDPTNYDVFDSMSELYDTKLNEIQPEDLSGTDVIFRMTPEQFGKFETMSPEGIYFRVYHDKSDTNVNNGVFYDSEYRETPWLKIPRDGTFIVIAATENEFATFEALGEFG